MVALVALVLFPEKLTWLWYERKKLNLKTFEKRSKVQTWYKSPNTFVVIWQRLSGRLLLPQPPAFCRHQWASDVPRISDDEIRNTQDSDPVTVWGMETKWSKKQRLASDSWRGVDESPSTTGGLQMQRCLPHTLTTFVFPHDCACVCVSTLSPHHF